MPCAYMWFFRELAEIRKFFFPNSRISANCTIFQKSANFFPLLLRIPRIVFSSLQNFIYCSVALTRIRAVKARQRRSLNVHHFLLCRDSPFPARERGGSHGLKEKARDFAKTVLFKKCSWIEKCDTFAIQRSRCGARDFFPSESECEFDWAMFLSWNGNTKQLARLLGKSMHVNS